MQGVEAQHLLTQAEQLAVGGGQIDLPHRRQVGVPVGGLDEVVGLQRSLQPDGEDGLGV